MITKQQWEKLVNRQDTLKKELAIGFEVEQENIFNEILDIEGILVRLEN